MTRPGSAFKVFTDDQWVQFLQTGVFAGSPIDIADGYIHLSTGEQLEGTLARHFSGQTGLVIAEIDLGCLETKVRWEPARNGDLFPHVYGKIDRAAVIGSRTEGA
jgi:uncharacterized protein (DUF952 family)